MMFRTGRMGTDVNNAVTSYDIMHSPCLSLTSLMRSIKSLVLWTWWLDNPTNGFKILVNSFAVLYVLYAVPYNEGLSETFKNICKRYGIQAHFKSGKTIKDELVAPKDQDHITKKSGIIYRYKCDRLDCDHEYIGETARTFGERFKEHLKAPSPIFDHSNISGHSTTINNFTVVGREEQNLSRLIKESMFIRVNNPSLNKNIGKYHLPHIWDEVLVNNTELELK